jgi:hypothetical protein
MNNEVFLHKIGTILCEMGRFESFNILRTVVVEDLIVGGRLSKQDNYSYRLRVLSDNTGFYMPDETLICSTSYVNSHYIMEPNHKLKLLIEKI